MSEREIGRKEYQGFYKDNEGEAHIVDMVSKTIEPNPDIDIGDFIRQASPTQIRVPRYKKPLRTRTATMTFGDAQMPFHDEAALQAVLRGIEVIRPDNITIVGDMIDLPQQGKYEHRKEWADAAQQGIDRMHLFLSEIRARHIGRLALVHGNHEERMPKMLRRDAAELIGLRRANAEKELGVLTLSFLVRYEELGVEAITGYPNGVDWLEDNLQAIHGDAARKGGATASVYLRRENISTIFGHDHRMQMAMQTRNSRYGGTTTVAASSGCLADLNGGVPSQFYTTDDTGERLRHAPDWQHGANLVMHDSERHDVTPLRIVDGVINIGDRYY